MNYNEHIIKWNKYYLKNKLSVSWGSIENDSHIDDFIDYLNLSGSDYSIIDVGCGYGKNSSIFLKEGYKYTGIDIAKEPIVHASKNIQKGHFILGNILNYKFEDKFDIIIDAGCIHVNDKKNVDNIISKYFNILNDEGSVFVRLFKSDKISNDPLFIIDDILPVWGYTEKEILKYFGEKFIINKIILDKDYYDEDHIFYLYLKKNKG